MTSRRSLHAYRLLAQVSVLQLAVAFALRVVRWPTLRRAMPLFRAVGVTPFGAIREPDFLWALDASARRLPRVSNCLVRGLVAELVLDSREDPVQITIGVRRIAATLEAHAWVERNGSVIVGEARTAGAPPVQSSFVPMLVCRSSRR